MDSSVHQETVRETAVPAALQTMYRAACFPCKLAKWRLTAGTCTSSTSLTRAAGREAARSCLMALLMLLAMSESLEGSSSVCSETSPEEAELSIMLAIARREVPKIATQTQSHHAHNFLTIGVAHKTFQVLLELGPSNLAVVYSKLLL